MEKPKYDFVNEDKRILERNLRRHRISQQDYQKLLKALPDETGRFEEVAVYSGSDENPPDKTTSD